MAGGQRQRTDMTNAQPTRPSHSRARTTGLATEAGNRPARAHRPPQRYRDNTSGEYIDFERELGPSDGEDEDPPQVPVARPPDPLAIVGTGATDQSDPLGTGKSNQGQTRRNVAYDVHHFFRKEEQGYYCNICQCSYALGSSTTTRRGHLDRQHPLAYLEKIEENDWTVQSPLLNAALARGYSYRSLREALGRPGARIDCLPPPPPLQQGDKIPAGKQAKMDPGSDLPEFSVPALHALLVEFIVSDDQAIYMVEHLPFRRLLLFLHPEIDNSDIPHRTKTRELILQEWVEDFSRLKQELKSAIGAISFTADIWSSNKRDSYLAVTAHWIGEESGTANSGQLVMRAALIAFHYLPSSHTGEEIAKAMVYLIDRAEIPLTKIGYITMDNASNNDTAMAAFARIVQEDREVEFDAVARRLRCIPHIINICVQHVIQSFSSADFSDVPKAWGVAPRTLTKSDYVKAVREDPISQGRGIVRCIRHSGQRRRSFEQTIDSGNADQVFMANGKPLKLPVVQLYHDVGTRWDSTYYMINRLRVLRQAVDRWVSAPRNVNLTQPLTGIQWEVLQDLEFALNVPAMVHHTMTSEWIPLLGGALPAYETFVEQWKRLSASTANPQFGPLLSEGLVYAERYYKLMRANQAYTFAMFIHPSIRFSWVERKWSDEISSVKTSILNLMVEYREKHSIDSVRTTPTMTKPAFMGLASLYGMDTMEIAPTVVSEGMISVEEEFGSYIATVSAGDADPLAFWKLEHSRFPTIYRIAMDFLPVQPSSVPCERIFSSSAETDTKKRNRINSTLMEALQMLKFSLKQNQFHFARQWSTKEYEMLQDQGQENVLSSLVTPRLANSKDVSEALTEVLDEMAEYDNLSDEPISLN